MPPNPTPTIHARTMPSTPMLSRVKQLITMATNSATSEIEAVLMGSPEVPATTRPDAPPSTSVKSAHLMAARCPSGHNHGARLLWRAPAATSRALADLPRDFVVILRIPERPAIPQQPASRSTTSAPGISSNRRLRRGESPSISDDNARAAESSAVPLSAAWSSRARIPRTAHKHRPQRAPLPGPRLSAAMAHLREPPTDNSARKTRIFLPLAAAPFNDSAFRADCSRACCNRPFEISGRPQQ